MFSRNIVGIFRWYNVSQGVQNSISVPLDRCGFPAKLGLISGYPSDRHFGIRRQPRLKRNLLDMAEKEKSLAPAEMTKRKTNEQYKEWPRSVVKNVRCGILPSPEALKTDSSRESDETNTIKDFKEMANWLSKVFNTDCYKFFREGSDLDEDNYTKFIQFAYGNPFASLRQWGHPELEDLVIWYYTGHGVPNDKLPNAWSMPDLTKAGFTEGYIKSDKNYIDVKKEKVKGGELCLHHVGFCGLEGLLQPWIASVRPKSQYAECKERKNKHFLIILDSCHSGNLAKKLEELNKKPGPWNQGGCTVTVQAACGPDEVTYGGYFTPCFKFFSENQQQLKERSEEWSGMDEEKREHFRRIKLPSPKLVTTRSLNEREKRMPVFLWEIGNFKLSLFQDPGFFKFCAIQQFQLEEEEKLHSERVLNPDKAADFMKSATFKVIDYKLKELKQGPYEGAPMGLFLLEDPSDPTKYAVCAHIHFKKNDTSKVGGINLVHHVRPPMGEIRFTEDHDGLSNNQIRKSRHKIPYAMVPACANANKKDPSHWSCWDWETGIPVNSLFLSDEIKAEIDKAKRLLKACHDFVEAKESGRWADVGQWNMTSKDLGVMGLFKKKQRSAWMDQYLKTYGYTYQDHSDTTSTTG